MKPRELGQVVQKRVFTRDLFAVIGGEPGQVEERGKILLRPLLRIE